MKKLTMGDLYSYYLDVLKNDALDLATGNRATYTKIANEIEKKFKY